MAPYPSPLADTIERCASAITSPKVRDDPEYAAEWSMLMLHAATVVRMMEMPEEHAARLPPRMSWKPILWATGLTFLLITVYAILNL